MNMDDILDSSLRSMKRNRFIWNFLMKLVSDEEELIVLKKKQPFRSRNLRQRKSYRDRESLPTRKNEILPKWKIDITDSATKNLVPASTPSASY